MKPTHSSSHWVLANIHQKKNNSIQTLLATHFFLLLEPNSSRSKYAYQLLMDTFQGNVSQDKSEPNSIQIFINSDEDLDEGFSAAELTIRMIQATNLIEDGKKEKSAEEKFIKGTKTFFSVMGELKKEESKGIWWELYTPFFKEIGASKHMETYCMYISQSGNPIAAEWLKKKKNRKKLEAFIDWINKE